MAVVKFAFPELVPRQLGRSGASRNQLLPRRATGDIDIQRRGRWGSRESVARSGKGGRVQG
eukprot:36544-Pyramimonas_sp.AAC.1